MRQIALLTSIPLALMTGPACGYFIGNYIDQKFQTDPWAMVSLTIIGGIAGVREMIGLIRRTTRNE
jgi:F0F1-type ATP synthase assembly protein I